MGELRYVDGLILEYLLYTHAKALTPGFKSEEEQQKSFDSFVELLKKSGAMPAETTAKQDSAGEQANPGA